MFGKEKYNIMAAAARAVEKGDGLQPHEILGNANDAVNKEPIINIFGPQNSVDSSCRIPSRKPA